MADREIDIDFVTFEDVCRIHERGLIEFGEGMQGFLDENTVRSAAAQPQAAMYDQYFYEFPSGMAAAYLYYRTNQQGFINGNKRTAVGAAISFLARNGYKLKATSHELFSITCETVAEGARGDRHAAIAKVADWIRGGGFTVLVILD